MSELPERTVGAAMDHIGPRLDIRCDHCAGTGNDPRSHLDCTRCKATGYRIRQHPWREEVAREATIEVFAAAMDPALGPDRLVVAGPFEREIIEKVCAWLDERENDMNAPPLDWHRIARKIEDHFAQPERTQ